MHQVHWLSECLTCGKRWGQRNAIACGVRHSRATGHEVVAEIGLSGRWIGGEPQ